MDTNRMKKAAEWFYINVFKDESISISREVPPKPPVGKLPSALRAARSLETGLSSYWQPREAVFLKQAKLLANYEDDFDFRDSVTRYFPTYQSLTDRELRGYFSWRTKLRRGEVYETSLSFVYLYIYELLNQIGVADPMDGWRKLDTFKAVYGQLDKSVLPYLEKWMTDYAVYYDLDPALLANSPQVVFHSHIAVLDTLPEQEERRVLEAVKALAPRWLSRSKFYAQYPQDMDRVILRVLGRIWDHCARRCKKSMVEQYFGPLVQQPIRLFESAVFCDPEKKRSGEYPLDPYCRYLCRGGLWSVQHRPCTGKPNAKLESLVKAIDARMRQAFDYGHPIKSELDTKWILTLIQEEIQALQQEKQAAEAKTLTIDYSALAKIRRDAAITREKLTVEEEMDAESLPPEPEPEAPPQAPPEDGGPLTGNEYRLLQSLLYTGDYTWVQREGLMLSVLVDRVNEALYDEFMDSVLVLDDRPQVLEDYIDDLKEMVRP